MDGPLFNHYCYIWAARFVLGMPLKFARIGYSSIHTKDQTEFHASEYSGSVWLASDAIYDIV